MIDLMRLTCLCRLFWNILHVLFICLADCIVALVYPVFPCIDSRAQQCYLFGEMERGVCT